MARERELPPPLEMMCLNALWELGEGTVEEVRKTVSVSRPLAYTTVLTLLDRLARRGAVSRRKEGRGFRYQVTVDRDKLRRIALRQLLEHHFSASEPQLLAFLERSAIANQAAEISARESAAANAAEPAAHASAAAAGAVAGEP